MSQDTADGLGIGLGDKIEATLVRPTSEPQVDSAPERHRPPSQDRRPEMASVLPGEGAPGVPPRPQESESLPSWSGRSLRERPTPPPIPRW